MARERGTRSKGSKRTPRARARATRRDHILRRFPSLPEKLIKPRGAPTKRRSAGGSPGVKKKRKATKSSWAKGRLASLFSGGKPKKRTRRKKPGVFASWGLENRAAKKRKPANKSRKEPAARARGQLAASTPADALTRPAPPEKKKGRKKTVQKGEGRVWRAVSTLAFHATVVALLIFSLGVLALSLTVARDLPQPDNLTLARTTPQIVVLGRAGDRIAVRGTGSAGYINLSEVPADLIDAVIAVEDRRFFEHSGVDLQGILRALIVNLQSGEVRQGGSTITQQLAKNLFLSPDRTMKRKLQEMLLARWLERHYSKEDILGLYLSRVYFGSGAYGVEAAAQRYFGREVQDLTLAQSAMLAGLLKAPSRFSPVNNPQLAERRMALVLEVMVDAGFIESGTAEAARLAGVGDAGQGGARDHWYFVDWVIDRAREKVGEVDQDLIIETTFDRAFQEMASVSVRTLLAGEGRGANASEAALVMLSPDGALRAMIGGRNYRESSFNRAAVARRQPGSAFKPFVFIAGLENQYTPFTTLTDQPVSVGNWRPENFEEVYRGEVTLTEALAVSSNAVAVRIAEAVGRGKVVEVARRLGITAPLSAHRSLSLGTEEVTLLELTGAYGAFANGGRKATPFAITRISTRAGAVLYERPRGQGALVLSPHIVGEMNHMLSASVSWGTGKAAKLGEALPQAGKTGTSQDYRDAWFVGYTADYVTGVWVGNDDNSPMLDGEGRGVTGGGLPAVIWRAFMEQVGTDGLRGRDLPGRALAFSRKVQPRTEELPSPREQEGFDNFLSRLGRQLGLGGPSSSADFDRYSE